MKIVLEGCDCSGKTTLARRLAEILPDCRIEHDSKPCTKEEYIARLSQPGNVVFDRLFLGQFVYNNIYERAMSTWDLDEIREYCHAHPDILLLYICPSKDEILRRMAGRSSEERASDEQMMHRLGCNTPEEYIDIVMARYDIVRRGFTVITGKDLYANNSR